MNKQVLSIIAIVVVVIGIGSYLAIKYSPETKQAGKTLDSKSLMRETSHTIGSKTAKVQLVEFGDYQCPACAALNPAILKIKAEYQSNPNFSFTFRHFPLGSHAHANEAAYFTEAAGAQGKFWEMHDLIYEKQKEWSELENTTDYFASLGSTLSLDIEKMKTEVKNGTYQSLVSTDLSDGKSLQVASTPTVFINGEKIGGRQIPSYEELKTKIDAELAK